MTRDVAIYQEQCRNCEHEISVGFPVNVKFVNEDSGKRIRCANCRTTNYVAQQETVE